MPFRHSFLFSVIRSKCPRCHEGDLFLNPNPYALKTWDKMHADCPECGLHFEREPGFFQGAMYVSYALGVALSAAILVINIIVGFDVLVYFVSNTLAILGMAPLLFRWSRALYLHIFIRSDRKKRSHKA